MVFTTASPSTSALSDAVDWVTRLRRAFGSPNHVGSMELCGWGRHLATTYTFGAPVPGAFMPDLDHAGCILFWGYNPSLARIAHATAAVAALNRGARLIVVDPRRVGLASRAEPVAPGAARDRRARWRSAIAHVMIERGWFDRDFVRDWTNGPLLVREDNGRLLRADDIDPSGEAGKYVAWDAASGRPVTVRPGAPASTMPDSDPALCRQLRYPDARGPDRLPARCSRFSPTSAAGTSRRRPRRSPASTPAR